MRGIKEFFRAALYGCIIWAALCTCNLVSLQPLEVKTYPSEKDAILGTADAVWIEFPEAVEKTTAEVLLKIQDPEGAVEGDRSWSGNRLLVSPLKPWVSGVRYVLQFSGSIDTEDGRTYTLNITVPFYAGSTDTLPRLLTVSPDNEGIIGITDTLALTFSETMDADLFEDYFSLSPNTAYTLTWNLATCTVAPETQWQGLTRYSWIVPTEVTNTLSMPLAEEYRGSFRIIADTSAPVLQTFRGAVWDDIGGSYILYDIGFLDNDMALWFEFSKEMDWSTWDDAFSIDPAIQAVTTFVTPTVVTVDPQEYWIPEQLYALSLSADLKDIHGNHTALVTQSFTPDVPAQGVIQIDNTPAVSALPSFVEADWAAGDPLDIEVTAGTLEHTFTLYFSQPYQPADIERLLQALVFEASYPATLIDPVLKSISFNAVSPQELTLIYADFEQPQPGGPVRHFYRFHIPADKTATTNRDGSYFTEALTIHFEVVLP